MESKSNLPTIVFGLVGVLVYAAVTYAVVEVAGGADVESSYSNTPNGVTPGPPPFK